MHSLVLSEVTGDIFYKADPKAYVFKNDHRVGLINRKPDMRIEEIRRNLGSLPHMSFYQAKIITDFISKNQLCNILELGFKHGVSTCYMASVLQELGKGQITTIDLEWARKAEPNVDSLLKQFGLSAFATVYYEPTSYVWRLMKLIEENPKPRFDLCFIDGAHTWFVDGFAFFLVDRLLVRGGWIILDDLDWTFGSSYKKDADAIRGIPAEERETAQVRKIYELLVKSHPAYGNFMVKDGWAYAQKISTDSNKDNLEPKKEFIYERVGLGGAIFKIAERLAPYFLK